MRPSDIIDPYQLFVRVAIAGRWFQAVILIKLADPTNTSCLACNDFTVDYFAAFEEKQMRLKALRNRQDLFQEEVRRYCQLFSFLFY